MEAVLSNHRVTRLIIVCLLIGMSAGMSFAQDQENDQQEQEQALPDIAPREIEITGTLEVSFPSLQRQPLIGFNPPPLTYEVPETRKPYIEEYKQEAAELPNSPLKNPQPPQAANLYGTLNRGILKVGGGRYLQRTLFGAINYAIRPRFRLYSEIDYNGLRGHDPFDNGILSGFDTFDGTIGVTSHRAAFQIRAALSGFYDEYALYGADAPAKIAIPLQPERQGAGAHASVAIESYGVFPSRLELQYGATRYETAPHAQGEVLEQTERRLQLEGALNKRFNAFSFSIDGAATAGALGSQALVGSDYFSYDTGISAGWFGPDVFDITLGARLLGYSASVDNGSGRLMYISPQGQLTIRPSVRLQLYVRNTPSVTMHSIAGLFEENPYLTPRFVVKPTIATIDLEGGLHIYRGIWEFSVWGGFQEYPIYRYFQNEHAVVGEFTGGFFEVAYDEARIIHAGGRVALQLPQGLHADLELNFRQGRLTDNTLVIPYFAPVTSTLSLSYPFLENKGLVQLQGTIYSSRYVDLANEERVGAYMDFDAEASYDILESFGLYVKVENMSVGALERWAHYPRPPFVAQGGIRLFW